MAEDKIIMPSGQGGLVRYFENYKSKFHIKPAHVIIMVIVVMMIEALLYIIG